MRRYVIAGLLLAAAAAPMAEAGPLGKFFANMRRDYRRNNCWPDPFVAPDRAHVYAPFGVMVQNGWRAYNTLGEHHFRPDDARLNEAGVNRLRAILSEAPPEYRAVFVAGGADPQLTAARVAEVQELVQSMVLEGDVPPVMANYVPVRGWPAEYINNIGTRFAATTPEPRIPASGGSSSGSSQGGQ
jgi:hypothetical protein